MRLILFLPYAISSHRIPLFPYLILFHPFASYSKFTFCYLITSSLSISDLLLCLSVLFYFNPILSFVFYFCFLSYFYPIPSHLIASFLCISCLLLSFCVLPYFYPIRSHLVSHSFYILSCFVFLLLILFLSYIIDLVFYFCFNPIFILYQLILLHPLFAYLILFYPFASYTIYILYYVILASCFVSWFYPIPSHFIACSLGISYLALSFCVLYLSHRILSFYI